MKTKTITALEQALADLGRDMSPRRPDEITVYEMHDAFAGDVSMTEVSRRLRALVASGAYVRRKLGREYLYRKVTA